MSGARLFTLDEYPLERGERNRRCLEWLQSLVTLFKADLTDEILPGCGGHSSLGRVLVRILLLPWSLHAHDDRMSI
ncbi:unnamed protein product [Closterium sp. NIES-53]